MIKFKQKEYNEAVGVGKKVINLIKKNPLQTASLGVATAGLGVQVHRSTRDRSYQKDQLKAMNNLTNSLGKVDRSFKDLGKKEVDREKKMDDMMKKFRLFSIQDGGYKGGKRSAGGIRPVLVGAGVGGALGGIMGGVGEKTSIGVGALIGAGLGAFVGWMSSLADKSVFNTGGSTNANSYLLIKAIEEAYQPNSYDEDETTISETTTDEYGHSRTVTRRTQNNKKEVPNPRGIVFDVDGDPRRYVVSVLYTGNVLVMFINNPNNYELRTLNTLLDSYCYAYKNADYYSNKVSKNVYTVDVNVVAGTETYLAQKIIESGIKINIVTGNKFNTKFRQKNNSVLTDTITGATIGATAGGFTGSVFRDKTKQVFGINQNNKNGDQLAALAAIGTGTIIGAALGFLGGSIKEVATKYNRKNSVDQRLMKDVVENLKKSNLKEGTQFTRDPKQATTLKTKISIVISKVSGELRLLVNTVADPKLERLTKQMEKNIPNTSVVNHHVSDKFNDITISTISDSSADSGLIAGIAEFYIRNGYPVYLVEVG